MGIVFRRLTSALSYTQKMAQFFDFSGK